MRLKVFRRRNLRLEIYSRRWLVRKISILKRLNCGKYIYLILQVTLKRQD